MKSVFKEYSLAVAGFKFSELNILSAGSHTCDPDYRYGPAVRSHYLIHYVLKGSGVLHFDGKDYPVCAGQAFLIEPCYITCYEADSKEPWEYVWIGFDGDYAKSLLETAGISQFNPVFPKEFNCKLNNIFLNLRDLIRENSLDEMYILGSLTQIFSCLIDFSSHILRMYPKRTIYVNRAIDYINNNFHLPISVEELAKLLRIDRKYFCAIFKGETGISPIQYILSLKVSKASQLLIDTSFSIGEIARSVGYDDLFTFSRMFHQQTGVSPSQFRRTADSSIGVLKL
ncbi:MAG: AraC family transcriptional regulator [Bacillota bacterium]|nr:AraC family transcriptional regulator [Bacillota bacterium]